MIGMYYVLQRPLYYVKMYYKGLVYYAGKLSPALQNAQPMAWATHPGTGLAEIRISFAVRKYYGHKILRTIARDDQQERLQCVEQVGLAS